MVGLKRGAGYIGGVCEGLANTFGGAAIAWRILFLIVPYAFWVYLILWATLEKDGEF